MTLAPYSHAEGSGTTAGGPASHAEGNGTVTNNFAEHAEGSHNVSNKNSDTFGDAENTISSIGIGTSLADKKNAWEVMQNGDAYLLGVGQYDGTNPDDATSLQTTINAKQNSLTAGIGIIIENNTIDVDVETISSVEYVDANITDTMNFIIQERDSEHAGRVAGDDLLQANKQDKLTAGTNITIDANNVISAAGGGDVFEVTSETLSADLIEAFEDGKICIHKRYDNPNTQIYIASIKKNNTIIFNKLDLSYNPNTKKMFCGYVGVDVSNTTVSIDNYIATSLITDSYFAKTTDIGLVQPDNTTITVNQHGVISAVIPAPPTSDGQYVLSVVDGAYSWVSVPNANGNSF